MTGPIDPRSGWPWIAGKHELVRLVAKHHYDSITALNDMTAALSGVAPGTAPPSHAELLEAIDRSLEIVGREIASAATHAEVEAAKLRWGAYAEARDDMVATLLHTAHRLLQRPPFEDDDWVPSSWLIGYGRRGHEAPLTIVRPTKWEAGAPDWDRWQLVMPGGETYYGIRLLNLNDVDTETIQAILLELSGQSDLPQGDDSKDEAETGGKVDWKELSAFLKRYFDDRPTGDAGLTEAAVWEASKAAFPAKVVPRDLVRDWISQAPAEKRFGRGRKPRSS